MFRIDLFRSFVFPMQGTLCTLGNSPFVSPFIMRTYAREDEICKNLFPRVLAQDLYISHYSADRARPRYEIRHNQKIIIDHLLGPQSTCVAQQPDHCPLPFFSILLLMTPLLRKQRVKKKKWKSTQFVEGFIPPFYNPLGMS